MKLNFSIFNGLFFSFVLFLIGFILSNSIAFGICVANDLVTDAQCINNLERSGDPLLYGGLALSIVFFMLILIPVGYSAWRRFAVWFIPLATLLFIFYPEPGAWDFLSPMPEQLFQWVSVFYVAVSALLIGYANHTKSR